MRFLSTSALIATVVLGGSSVLANIYDGPESRDVDVELDTRNHDPHQLHILRRESNYDLSKPPTHGHSTREFSDSFELDARAPAKKSKSRKGRKALRDARKSKKKAKKRAKAVSRQKRKANRKKRSKGNKVRRAGRKSRKSRKKGGKGKSKSGKKKDRKPKKDRKSKKGKSPKPSSTGGPVRARELIDDIIARAFEAGLVDF